MLRMLECVGARRARAAAMFQYPCPSVVRKRSASFYTTAIMQSAEPEALPWLVAFAIQYQLVSERLMTTHSCSIFLPSLLHPSHKEKDEQRYW